MKYFKVRTSVVAVTPQGKFTRKQTEIVEARHIEDIFEHWLNRFGKLQFSMDAVEIEEKSIKPSTRIYVVI